ncbi:hypothetical protein COHA_008807 [Chlorella ohadii]|uniref:NADH dehydrogenase [ubiquinone] iron-sulfur protein 4, mitochondrial n=1 Tax=Chlorella ohadii TaxID=2649997 RepID=A0AAD5DJA6_9CHLO|nr:hypothetical protein COHA_008807 [Chlorella ohadii]
MALRSRALQALAAHARAFSTQTEIAVVSGLPPLDVGRKVIIYSPARTAGQQGISQTAIGGGPAWKVQHENKGKWINPLIGWTSTADPLENVARQLYFPSKEDAIAFAEKNGFTYEVQEYHNPSGQRPKRFLGYGDNFSVKRKGLPTGGLRSEQKK